LPPSPSALRRSGLSTTRTWQNCKGACSNSDSQNNRGDASDGGATWQELTGDVPHRKPLVLRYDPDAGELWAGGAGLYKLKQ
jgi:hypothetical protein